MDYTQRLRTRSTVAFWPSNLPISPPCANASSATICGRWFVLDGASGEAPPFTAYVLVATETTLGGRQVIDMPHPALRWALPGWCTRGV